MKKAINKIRMLAVGALALGQAFQVHAADANPPEQMTYQGYLVDGNGDPLGSSAPANYDVVFRIYKAKQGGLAIWGEQQTVTVDKGYFSVLLGEGSSTSTGDPTVPLSTIFQGEDISDRFIGITVAIGGSGDTEIAPRLRLLSSPFAFTAKQALKVTDKSGGAIFSETAGTINLGAGETPRLSLDADGNATFSGSLTADLSSNGVALQLNNNGQETLLEADSNSLNFKTTLPLFEFDQSLRVVEPDTEEAALELYGSAQGTGRLYLGQSPDFGGGIIYNGDGFPAFSGGTTDHISFYRRNNGVDHEVFKYYYGNNIVTFNGGITTASATVSGTLSAGEISTSGSLSAGAATLNGIVRINELLEFKAESTLPKLMIDSTAGGDVWTSQGAQITIGESTADGGAAAMNMTYRGDGYGWVGAGSISDGVPSGGHVKFHYTGGNTIFNRDVQINRADNASYINLHSANWPSIAMNNYQDETRSIYTGDNFIAFGLNHSVHSTGWRYAAFYGGSGFSFGSDRRYKTDINEIEPILDRLLDVQVRRFKWKGAPNPEMTDVGVVAQELQPLFPGLITKTYDEELKDDALSVQYTTLGVLAVKGLQELKDEKDAEISELRNENENLKSRMESMTSEMAVLKARLASSTTQEDRIAKLEELVSKIGQGQ